MKQLRRLLWIVGVVSVWLLEISVVSAAAADWTYYNMQGLTGTELALTFGKPCGTVIVVQPNDTTVVIGREAEEMVSSNKVRTVIIAGVGSQGTAAFAKHVARSINQPVAGIVNGTGDMSSYIEDSQDYFIGRSFNTIGQYYPNPASQKLYDLYADGARPERIIGHSKGNLDIANALFKMYSEGHGGWYRSAKMVTFGCGVNVPANVNNLDQYLGTLDALGISNTVSFRNLHWVVGRYHTTNPFYQLTYMPIEYYLK